MTISELIQELKKFAPEMVILVQEYDDKGRATDRGDIEAVLYDQDADLVVIV